PPVCEKQRLPRKVFRRSLAGRSDSLSTLRRVGYPDPTQDSLPAAGQALLGGLVPAGFLRKVSECFLHLILLPQAFLGQTHRPRSFGPRRPRFFLAIAKPRVSPAEPEGQGAARLRPLGALNGSITEERGLQQERPIRLTHDVEAILGRHETFL